MLWQINGDARALPIKDETVQCVVTSPPYYGLRNYQVSGQIGIEKTYVEYVAAIVQALREIHRVLRKDGTCWLNIADSYASGKGTCHNPGGNTSSFNVHLKEQNVHPLDRGNKSTLAVVGLKPKDLIGIPWRVAFALQEDGWYLRQDIIWAKPNPMPESVRDRCTKAHEYIFLLTKSARYFYDADAISQPATQSSIDRLSQPTLDQQAGGDRVPGKTNGNMKAVFGGRQKHAGYETRIHSGREDQGNYIENGVNKRSVWTIATQPTSLAHFATFPEALVLPCILAGSRPGDIVLDPFAGTGTVGKVALEHGRKAVMVDLKREYLLLDTKKRHPQIGMGL